MLVASSLSYLGRRSAAGDGGSAVAPTWGAVGSHTAGSIVAAYPTGISAGHYLELTVVGAGSDSTTTYTVSGWTKLAEHFMLDPGSATVGTTLAVFYKTATGSESGTVTPSVSGTTPARQGAVIERYSGVDTSGTPYEGLNESSLSGSPLNPPDTTTTANGRLLVYKYASVILDIAPEAGWTEVWEFIRSGIGTDYLFTSHQKTAVGFGTQAGENPTTSSGLYWVCISYALKGV